MRGRAYSFLLYLGIMHAHCDWCRVYAMKKYVIALICLALVAFGSLAVSLSRESPFDVHTPPVTRNGVTYSGNVFRSTRDSIEYAEKLRQETPGATP